MPFTAIGTNLGHANNPAKRFKYFLKSIGLIEAVLNWRQVDEITPEHWSFIHEIFFTVNKTCAVFRKTHRKVPYFWACPQHLRICRIEQCFRDVPQFPFPVETAKPDHRRMFRVDSASCAPSPAPAFFVVGAPTVSRREKVGFSCPGVLRI